MQTNVKGMKIGDFEENSGVEFPGESLEPLVGSLITFETI